jgi:hypothetical protein
LLGLIVVVTSFDGVLTFGGVIIVENELREGGGGGGDGVLSFCPGEYPLVGGFALGFFLAILSGCFTLFDSDIFNTYAEKKLNQSSLWVQWRLLSVCQFVIFNRCCSKKCGYKGILSKFCFLILMIASYFELCLLHFVLSGRGLSSARLR